MAVLDINISAVVVFTNKLEKLHRSALPNAIRSALNSAAFDVKTNTMPKKAAADFTNRTKTFFKYHSSVEMARGWNMNKMMATVGFSSEKLNIRSTNFSVKDLEEQEYGGDIGAKSFIPLDEARLSKSNSKVVAPANRLTNLDLNKMQSSLRSSIKKKGGSPKAAFNAAAMQASANGGLVLGNKLTKNGSYILWKIESSNSISLNKNISLADRKAGKMKFKMKAIYSYKQGRKVNVEPVGFMRFASMQSANKLESFYIQAAERQIQRLMK